MYHRMTGHDDSTIVTPVITGHKHTTHMCGREISMYSAGIGIVYARQTETHKLQLVAHSRQCQAGLLATLYTAPFTTQDSTAAIQQHIAYSINTAVCTMYTKASLCYCPTHWHIIQSSAKHQVFPCMFCSDCSMRINCCVARSSGGC